MSLPRDILDRVARTYEYHRASKEDYQSLHAIAAGPNWANRPSVYRTLDSCPKVALETTLLDAPASALAVLAGGVAAVPDSQLQPTQDVKTLSTWLYLADGITTEQQVEGVQFRLRSCPSSGALYPFEIYVAAFGIEGLEPGLYHYNVREFGLCKMRQGPETLLQLKRGRPDLDFLKTVPAVLLISTIFCRSAWQFRQRGYRYALLDCGQLVQNVITAAAGLGISTTTRLRMNDKTMRELIGVPADADFAEAEAVQAMVVWAEQAASPMPYDRPAAGIPTMPPISRKPLSQECVSYGSILAAHDDCVAPGMAIREIRAPLTELSPLTPSDACIEIPSDDDMPDSQSLRQTLLTRRSCREFMRARISRRQLVTLNHLAMQGGSCFPIFPSGTHVGLLRAYWIVHDVTGVDPGIWYYHVCTDQWTLLRPGEYRMEAQYLALEQPICGDAAVVCVLVADLATLLQEVGPDVYRLAHLEAGMVSDRIQLAASAMEVGSTAVGGFYDEELRKFLELEKTGWEPIYAIAIGVPFDPNVIPPALEIQ